MLQLVAMINVYLKKRIVTPLIINKNIFSHFVLDLVVRKAQELIKHNKENWHALASLIPCLNRLRHIQQFVLLKIHTCLQQL